MIRLIFTTFVFSLLVSFSSSAGQFIEKSIKFMHSRIDFTLKLKDHVPLNLVVLVVVKTTAMEVTIVFARKCITMDMTLIQGS